MQEVLAMSTKERQALTVISRIRHQKLKVREGADELGLTERQMYRLLKRFAAEGDRGLLHRLRGRPSNRGYAKSVQQEVVNLYKERYPDYGPTLFGEMLQELHELSIDANTLRRWLKAEGLWQGVRARRKHRKKRERRPAIGDLLQFDGSFHEWFEERGPRCCLLVAIDDASSRIDMRFAESENARDVLAMLWEYVTLYGIPRQFYCDFGAVYRSPKGRIPSDVAHALTRLGVEILYARSPQAKGRVERSNRTHQDRLVKALRREGISTIPEANRYLREVYLAEHNRHFAQTEGLRDVHRTAEGLDLKNIFCFETTRTVYNDYTIMLSSQYVQLEHGEAPLPVPGQKVTLRRHLKDDSLHILWHGTELSYRFLEHRPIRTPYAGHPAKDDHPWHRSDLGNMRKKVLPRQLILAKRKAGQSH